MIFESVRGFISYFNSNVNILGNDPISLVTVTAALMLFVRIVDFFWNLFVGIYVDKRNPKLGKYRSYLVTSGFPLCILAVLCFWDIAKGIVIYAVITYTLLQMSYTLINVPYSSLNASMTRDIQQISILTTTRMTMANISNFLVFTCFLLLLKL